MSDKIDMIYDLTTRIDERQRSKAEKDAERHAKEDSRMGVIEEDLREHKEGVIQNRARIMELERHKTFKDTLKTKATKLTAILASIAGLGYTIYRMFA